MKKRQMHALTLELVDDQTIEIQQGNSAIRIDIDQVGALEQMLGRLLAESTIRYGKKPPTGGVHS